jgi:sialate O-acetylesterase
VKKFVKPFLLSVVLNVFLFDFAFAQDKWKRIINLEGDWKFAIGDNKKWADLNYSDKDWETIDVPSNWEDEGFNGYDGYAWYRISFDATSLNKSSAYNLLLGYIDDVDEVFLNGRRIGSSGAFPPRLNTAYNSQRNYFIPNEYVNFTGRNVIAVRVFDSGLEGGIVSGDVGIFTNDSDRALTVNLRGQWDFVVQDKKFGLRNYSTNEKRTPPENAEWAKISVPSPWENQGYDYDGNAWYRKQFMVPKNLEGEDLVLVLGKIDDFDQTYLNGKLVGSTDDWERLRIYHISSDMVKPGALNLLLIYVDDRQGLGGIYEGPVGLMKQSEFTRYMRYRDR